MGYKEFTEAYAKRMKIKEATAEKYLEGFIEILCDEFEKGESVTVKNLGRFYCKEGRHNSTKVFKFSPARRIKNVLGWS